MGNLISVVIATYNRASKIVPLLQDISNQNTQNFKVECIVTNDGSKDNTQQVLQEFEKSHSKGINERVTFKFLHQQNAGQARARQKAIDICLGDVIVILDDDMRIPSKTFLQTYYNHFYPDRDQLDTQKPLNKVVLGRMNPPDNNITRQPFEYFYERSLAQMYNCFLNGNLKPRGGDLFTGNVALTKQAFQASGGFSERFKYGEDKELGLRLENIAGSEFVFENEALSIHHSDTPSMKVFSSRARKHGFFDCEIQRMYPENTLLGPANVINLPGKMRKNLVEALIRFDFLRSFFVELFSKAADLIIKAKSTNLASYCCSIVYLAAYIDGAIEGMNGKAALRENLHDAKLKMELRC
jgi:glycosyltransferase involved in cell wall biosynthesis